MTVPPPISASSMGVVLPPDRKKRKLADKILAQKVRDLVPESQVKSVFKKCNIVIVRGGDDFHSGSNEKLHFVGSLPQYFGCMMSAFACFLVVCAGG